MVPGGWATVYIDSITPAADTGFPWSLARSYHIRVEIMRINFYGKTCFVADKKTSIF